MPIEKTDNGFVEQLGRDFIVKENVELLSDAELQERADTSNRLDNLKIKFEMKKMLIGTYDTKKD